MSNLFGSHIDSNINDLIENTEKIKNYLFQLQYYLIIN